MQDGERADSYGTEAEVMCRRTIYKMDGMCAKIDKDRWNLKNVEDFLAFLAFLPTSGSFTRWREQIFLDS